MTLTEIEYGSLASSATINSNFQYLQDKITELSALITSETSGYSSTVATLNNSISELLNCKDSFIPVGAIIPIQDSTIPTGFLLCDGSELKVADYGDLYTAIGKTYGQTDSTKFNLPDLRNKTLWGIGSSTTLGEYLKAALPNITGTYTPSGAYFGSATGAFYQGPGSASTNQNYGGSGSNIAFDASRSSSIYSNDATTVQPPAIVTNFVIKY